MIKVIDGLPCRLQTDCNLDFLSAYGRVFRVLDDQDSGNLCFGLERGERRYFLKFAGAQTLRYQGTPEQAVKRLKQASATVSYTHLYVPDPNCFGGPVRLLRPEDGETKEMPLLFDYKDNSRALGLADMAHALQTGRPGSYTHLDVYKRQHLACAHFFTKQQDDYCNIQ